MKRGASGRPGWRQHAAQLRRSGNLLFNLSSVYPFILVSLGLGAALLSGCGKAGNLRPAGKDSESVKSVKVAQAQVRPMTQAITVTGTLAAQEKSMLSAKVAGRLQTLPVDLGERGSPGRPAGTGRAHGLRIGAATGQLPPWPRRAPPWACPRRARMTISQLEQVSAVKQAKAVLDEATKNRDARQEPLAVGHRLPVRVGYGRSGLQGGRFPATTQRWKRPVHALRPWPNAGPNTSWHANSWPTPPCARPLMEPCSRGPPISANTSPPAPRSWSWSRPTRCACDCRCPSASAPWCAPGRSFTSWWKAIPTPTPARSPGSARPWTNKTACCWWKPMCLPGLPAPGLVRPRPNHRRTSASRA